MFSLVLITDQAALAARHVARLFVFPSNQLQHRSDDIRSAGLKRLGSSLNKTIRGVFIIPVFITNCVNDQESFRIIHFCCIWSYLIWYSNSLNSWSSNLGWDQKFGSWISINVLYFHEWLLIIASVSVRWAGQRELQPKLRRKYNLPNWVVDGQRFWELLILTMA